jgi:NAD-dependent dihydropyrimidine dehydrogenase PreA subunit
MKMRKIIKIDEKKCNGCGSCIPNCPEGALKIIDGKARLISDIFCDGLGACIGYCPEDAIIIEEREAEDYNEKKVMSEKIIKAGKNTIIAHLKHLKDHGQTKYYNEAREVLKEKGIKIDIGEKKETKLDERIDLNNFSDKIEKINKKIDKYILNQWPIQLHLVSPNSSFFYNKDLLLIADCVGYTMPNIFNKIKDENCISIACPKLDSNIESYINKLSDIIDIGKIKSLTVLIMEVPCCSGLLGIAKKAIEKASKNIPIKLVVISIKGEIIREEVLLN